jgi:GT2 family glycosyltransferase
MQKYYIVIPNWNGVDYIEACLKSLLAQSLEAGIIVVDNNSTDGSVELIEEKYSQVILVKNKINQGFAGGVNAGIRYALKLDAKYIALFNNDAVADKKWLENLVAYLDSHPKVGIAASRIVSSGKKDLDSTGELYTTWGLPFPRGRGEPIDSDYKEGLVFGASGGASLYRSKMLKEVGLFDKDFFAYYEDVDLSFRAQLAGWRVGYTPSAIAHHEIGATSDKIKDFTTYQTMKNLPMLFWKNVPRSLMLPMLPRFKLAYFGIFMSAVRRGQGWPALKGTLHFLLLLPKKLFQRRQIQKNRKVEAEYIESILTYDLPPGAKKLRWLRSKWWGLLRKKADENSH